MKKTWLQKMQDKPGYPKVLILQEGFPCYNALHKMGVNAGEEVVIVNPSDVISLMAGVPVGRLITLAEICKVLAEKHAVRGCCTLVTGIHIMTIANALEECKSNADSSILGQVPWWRTLKMDGFLNEKYPGGHEFHKALLEGEGFSIKTRGKKYQVKDWSQYLYHLI